MVQHQQKLGNSRFQIHVVQGGLVAAQTDLPSPYIREEIAAGLRLAEIWQCPFVKTSAWKDRNVQKALALLLMEIEKQWGSDMMADVVNDGLRWRKWLGRVAGWLDWGWQAWRKMKRGVNAWVDRWTGRW